MTDGTPKCKTCGSKGALVGKYQFFECGWCLDENGRELCACLTRHEDSQKACRERTHQR